MSNPIETNATKILIELYEHNPDQNLMFDGKEISDWTGLTPIEINNAIDYLDERDLLIRQNYLGTVPYKFGHVYLNSRGNYIYHEMQNPATSEENINSNKIVSQQPLAAGSPFGFTDIDWEFVQTELAKNDTLKVVFGYQFESSYYNTEQIKNNIKGHFQNAINKLNLKNGDEKMALNFKALAAGYGEHLFNQIARDIISSDIAVFETSDLNPNVMIEMGVALTWGKRVLPIKREGCIKPPTDISGQTYADYLKDAESFVSENHDPEILAMVERAMMKKIRN